MIRSISAAILALSLAGAALADVTATATMSDTTFLNLSTGSTNINGADIGWRASTGIFYQTNAKGFNVGSIGSTAYAALTQATLSQFLAGANVTPIPPSSLAVGDVFVVQGNSGNVTKAMVTASSSSISFQYTTYGASGSGGGGAPTITNVQNNSSTIPDGFSNSGVSPSSLIVIHGSNMADPNAPLVLWDVTNKALQTTQNGATINVIVNGTTVHPGIYYTSPAQIAAVLPANTPVGIGTISVTYSGQTSATTPIKVVASAFGINNYSGNTAVAQDSTSSTGALYTPTNSAKPGGFATLWGTGLGKNPDSTTDTTYTTSVSTINTQTDIYVGGVKATDVRFVGASVYPGVQIVVFAIPPGVPNGCFVPVVIVTGGNVVSNFPTLPIMNAGGVCSDSLFGINGTQISTLTGQSTVKSGSVFVGQLVGPGPGAVGANITTNFASANFSSVTGASYSSSGGAASIGSCIVTQVFSSGGALPTVTGLDAGSVNLTGPAGTYPLQTTTGVKGSYFAALPGDAIPANGGAFTFKWTGGADVGASSATVNLPTLLTWTNQPAAATIDRTQGLTVTWTGGASGSYVIIAGNSSTNGASGSYTCFAPQSALTFTVPSYVTLVLPAGNGTTTVENLASYTAFSAPGLDSGLGFGFTGTTIASSYK
ncbi:MAG TPA: hypothetical protein VNX18_15795 [Bryobacteraceae bacterium]|nr:hypothetical protein [Bryobacteraceae bacterium]